MNEDQRINSILQQGLGKPFIDKHPEKTPSELLEILINIMQSEIRDLCSPCQVCGSLTNVHRRGSAGL
jgi:hypothetical protein